MNEKLKEKRKNNLMFFSIIAIMVMFSIMTIPQNMKYFIFVGKIYEGFPLSSKMDFNHYYYMYNISGIVALTSLIMLAISLFKSKFFKHKVKNNSQLFYLFMIFLYLIIQGFNILFYEGVSNSRAFINFFYLLSFFFVINLTVEKRRLLDEKISNIIIYFGLLNSIITIIQFVFLMNNYNYDLENSLRLYRPPAFFPDAILSGIFLTFSLWLTLNNNSFSKFKRFLIIGSISVAGFVNGSRSFLILFLLAFLMYGFFNYKTKKNKAVLLITLFVLILFLVTPTDEFFVDLSRSNKILTSINLFKNSPLIGNGTQMFSATEISSGLKGTNPHNFLLQLLVETGLIGALPFIFLITLSLIKAYRVKNFKHLGILVLFITGSMIIGIGGSVQIMFVFFVYLGLIYSENNKGISKNICLGEND